MIRYCMRLQTCCMICLEVQLQTCLSLLFTKQRLGCTFTAAGAASVIHAHLLSGSFCNQEASDGHGIV